MQVPEPLEWHPLQQSLTLDAVAWTPNPRGALVIPDEERGTLYVRFLSGQTVAYADVPYYACRQMIEADSPGKVYNLLVRGLYATIEPGDDEPAEPVRLYWRITYAGIVGPWEPWDREVYLWSVRFWTLHGVPYHVDYRLSRGMPQA